MENKGTQGKQQAGINLADIFVQGAMRIVDMQTSAARVFLKTQGRSARLFGAPDWAQPINGSTQQISQLLTTGTEQALNLMRHTNETISEVQQQFGQLMQQQTAQLTQEMRHGFEEVSRRAEENLEQLRHTTERATEEAQQQLDEETQGESENGGSRKQKKRAGKRRSR
jgi:ABC-type transporter Mla subunit MlaD